MDSVCLLLFLLDHAVSRRAVSELIVQVVHGADSLGTHLDHFVAGTRHQGAQLFLHGRGQHLHIGWRSHVAILNFD